MTTRIRDTFFALLFLTVSPFAIADRGCSDPDSTLLWKVQGENSLVQLFGSLHLGEPGFYPLPEKIEHSFRGADHLVFEVDPRSMTTPEAQARMLQVGSLPPGESLSDHLSPQVIADLKSRLSSMGLPADNFLRFRPWFLTLMLGSLQYSSLGYLPDHGVEQYILREAAGDTAILELESLESQLGYLQHLDGQAFLAYTLAEFEQGQALAKSLVNAWRCADKEVLTALFAESFEMEGPLADDLAQLRDKLIVERNEMMAEKIGHYLEDGNGNYFVVVGSAHYLGNDSIVDLLREMGYKVEAVRL